MQSDASGGLPAITLKNVHKRYGSLQVLDGLSLNVERGEVYGFLGRNGAGKSTTIRLLMGITQADDGLVSLFGKDIRHALIPIRQRIGYVAQEQHFYPWMSPKVLGNFLKGFYPRWDKKRYAQLLERFELPLNRKSAVFSGGMKAKLALSVALSSKPQLLILDEPTAGMDPIARREFLDLVREEATQAGTTTFFSTHLIDDIESIASRIGIVENGKTIYDGSLQALSQGVVAYRIDSENDYPDALPGEFVRHATQVLQHAQGPQHRTLILKFAEDVPSDVLLNLGWRAHPMSLEDIFIAVVAGQSQGHN